MSRKAPQSPKPTEASGPVLAWCAGHRCTALHRLGGGDSHAEQIRATVKNTPGAILITSPCLGRCELAGVAAAARRDGPSGQIGPMVWFTGLESHDRFEALEAWIARGGPLRIHHPGHALPPVLDDAVCGTGPPPRTLRH